MTHFSGSGPGVQTKDGCSVELYRRMPYRGWLDIPASCLRSGSTVLQLGCGTGQGTRALLDLGFKVTAVDNSKEMIEHCPNGATKVLGDIEALELALRFDAVILPTGLINHGESSVRESFVACARRHLGSDGWLFVERQDPIWLRTAKSGDLRRNKDFESRIESVVREGTLIAMTLRYTIGVDTWLHSFQLVSLEDNDLQELLSKSGFGTISWLNEAKTWLRVQSVAQRA